MNASASKPKLTIAMRSCLLRASRTRLTQLHDSYDALSEHGDIGAQKRDTLFQEIMCVSNAISWLWLQPAEDE